MIEPLSPPGSISNKPCTICSPPRPLKARENGCAHSKMKNTMADIVSVPCSVSFRILRLKRRLITVINKAPRAPMEAASVGAATPPIIEPSTATTNSNTGKTSRIISFNSLFLPISARSVMGIAGTHRGLIKPTAIKYSI